MDSGLDGSQASHFMLTFRQSGSLKKVARIGEADMVTALQILPAHCQYQCRKHHEQPHLTSLASLPGDILLKFWGLSLPVFHFARSIGRLPTDPTTLVGGWIAEQDTMLSSELRFYWYKVRPNCMYSKIK